MGSEWTRSGDIAVDDRWPTWGPRAHAMGARSLLSVSLVGVDETIGALNIYSHASGGFAKREDVDLAILFSVHAALALTASHKQSGLETALHSRHLIGVAQGVLMERYGLTLEGSFQLLRRYSSVTNTKLADIARDLVTSGALPLLPDDTQA